MCPKNQTEKIVDKKKKEAFVAAYLEAVYGNQGTSDLAQALGISQKTVRRRCDEYGVSRIPLIRNNATKIRKRVFITAYNEIKVKAEATTEDLARKLGVCTETCKNYYKRYGLNPLKDSCKPRGGARKNAGRPRGSTKKNSPEEVELFGDQKKNSIEVGIYRTSRLSRKDYNNYARELINEKGGQ